MKNGHSLMRNPSKYPQNDEVSKNNRSFQTHFLKFQKLSKVYENVRFPVFLETDRFVLKNSEDFRFFLIFEKGVFFDAF